MTSSAVLFLLAHLIRSPAGPIADGAANQTIAAKWTADLRPAIGGEPLGLVLGRKRERQGKPKTSLWFLDDGTVVATYVTREESHPVLSGRGGSDPNEPLRLRAIFLDADTGKIRSTQAWPSESRLARIVAANDGKFVTQRGTTLTLHSSDGKELNTLSLPRPPQNLNGWNAHPSPTGKSILFENSDWITISSNSWILVSADDLKVVRSWKVEQTGPVGISDGTIAMTACMFPVYQCEPNLKVRGLATDWRIIAPMERSGWARFPRFVNDDTFFLSGTPGTPWKLLQSDGKVILSEDPPFGGGGPVSSPGEQRFILPFFKSKGGFAALDIGAHGELTTISVYDAPFRERSYLLAVKGPKIRESVQLALSPDGSKLAILDGETVYVFPLPPLKRPPGQN
ncbi:MAG: hypothetical protein WB683_07030 [Candidatus Sulfotelmatobacter sp.]